MESSEKSSGSVLSSESSYDLSSSEASVIWGSLNSSGGSSSGLLSSDGNSLSSGGGSGGMGSSGGGSSSVYSYAITFVYYEYGPYADSTETVIVTGAEPDELFGINMLGGFRLVWSSADSEWIIVLDVPTPASGTGALPNYEELSGGSTDIGDPLGYYVELAGAPFPNWSATVFLIP